MLAEAERDLVEVTGDPVPADERLSLGHASVRIMLPIFAKVSTPR